jgi:hypothetical protein
VPKSPDGKELQLSDDELRELHLALVLRITRLGKQDGKKMMPSERAKLKRRIELCGELDEAVQKLRGK